MQAELLIEQKKIKENCLITICNKLRFHPGKVYHLIGVIALRGENQKSTGKMT